MQILLELFKNYAVIAWPFALMHVFIVIAVGFSWRKITRETEDLRTFLGDHHNQYAGEIVPVLQQFISDSRMWGAEGIFIPMTDYSDRLDSLVDGAVSEMHDRTNLFIVVGIAGTIYGVFDFAHGASDILENGTFATQSKLLAHVLTSSMAKAFPVGFVGLLFTIVGQIVATIHENTFRSALTRATQKALQTRASSTHSPVQLIQEASQTMKEALAPIRNLEDLLSKSLQPVIETFGLRLDQSLKLVQQQFQDLNLATASVHQAAKGIETGVRALQSATDNMQSIVKDAPTVVANIIEMQENENRNLQAFDNHIRELQDDSRKIAAELQLLIDNFRHTPEEISKLAATAFDNIQSQSAVTWHESTERFAQTLQSSYLAVIEKMGEATNKMREDMTASTRQLEDFALSAKTLLTNDFKIAFQELFEPALSRYPDILLKISEFTQILEHLINEAGQVETISGKWFEEFRKVEETVHHLHTEIERLQHDEKSQADLIRKAMRDVQAEAERQIKELKEDTPAGRIEELYLHTPTLAIKAWLERRKSRKSGRD